MENKLFSNRNINIALFGVWIIVGIFTLYISWESSVVPALVFFCTWCALLMKYLGEIITDSDEEE